MTHVLFGCSRDWFLLGILVNECIWRADRGAQTKFGWSSWLPENILNFFPKASLMLGFCFRFSLKVPGSDTSCDDGDKKGFPFRCAADRACDAGWGCRPGVQGWLGGRRCGAGWGDGGVVQTGCARLAGNCPRARLAGWGAADWAWLETARERDWLAGGTAVWRKLGTRGWLETARERDWRGGRS